MKTMHRCILLLALFAIGPGGVALSQEASNPDRKQIAELINRLGADKYRDRESAQEALLTRDDVYLHLLRALPTLNAEGQRRARAILAELDQRRVKRFLQYGRDGRVDVFVEWSGLAGKTVDPQAYWQCVLDIAWDVLRHSRSESELKGWRKDLMDFPSPNYAEFLKGRPSFVREGDTLDTAVMPTHLTVREDRDLSGRRVTNCLLIATGSVTLSDFAFHNIVFALGDVAYSTSMHNLIISDGDVAAEISNDDVIVARGRISSRLDLRNRTAGRAPSRRAAIPSDRLNEAPLYDLLYRPGEPARRIFVPPLEELDNSASTVEKSPAGRGDKVRFFEVSDVGIELAEEGELRVTSLAANSPFAKAGLTQGDLIEKIDNAPARNANMARRRLRRAFVLGGTELTLHRDGKPLHLDVSFFGWELPSAEPAAAR